MDKYSISIDRAIEIATLAIHGLMEDDVEQAMEYFADTIELTEKECQFFGINAEEDKSDILEAVKQEGFALLFSSEEHQADKDVMLEAVKKDGWALQFASTELQADKDVVLEAVKNDGSVLCFASDELLADKDVVLEAVMDDGSALEFASEELQADKDVVLEAIKQYGTALQYASKELQADKGVVLEAEKQNGYALMFASEELQADKEVVLEAVKKDGNALQFANEKIQKEVEEIGGLEKWIEIQSQNLEPILLVPDNFLTGERIDTPRGAFSLTSMTREQMELAGYGYHHTSDDQAYQIMGNGKSAFAVKNEDNPLLAAELSTEQNFLKEVNENTRVNRHVNDDDFCL